MIDGYGRNINYLRISLTDRCNLRCRYCMSEEGNPLKKQEEILSFEQILRFIKVASHHGIHKIRLTGGEPLVRKNVISLIQQISEIEGIDEICLTTNGTLLKQYAYDLKKAKVNHINISLDTLKNEKYTYITRGGKLSEVLEGLELALKLFDQVKLNVVYMKDFNVDELDDFMKLTYQYHVEVRFIELMPIGEAKKYENQYASLKDMLEKYSSLIPIPTTNGVASLYQLPNAIGKIGIINAMSHGFCERCNRIRLTADGKIKPCLFAREEYDISSCNEEEMEEILQLAILNKPKGKGKSAQTKRNMNEIGG